MKAVSEYSDQAAALLRDQQAFPLAALVAWLARQEGFLWSVSSQVQGLVRVELCPQVAPFLVEAAAAVGVRVEPQSRFDASLVDPSGVRLSVHAGLWTARDASIGMAGVLQRWDALLRLHAAGQWTGRPSGEWLMREVPQMLRGTGSLEEGVLAAAGSGRSRAVAELAERLLGDVLAALRPGPFGSAPAQTAVTETFVGLVGWPLAWPRVVDRPHSTTEHDLAALLSGAHLIESARVLTDQPREIRVAAAPSGPGVSPPAVRG